MRRMVGSPHDGQEDWRIQFLAKLPRIKAETLLQNWLHCPCLPPVPDATVCTASWEQNLLSTQLLTASMPLLCQELDLTPTTSVKVVSLSPLTQNKFCMESRLLISKQKNGAVYQSAQSAIQLTMVQLNITDCVS